MGIPKIDITRNASKFFLRRYIAAFILIVSLHLASYLYFVPNNSFIMLVNILLFQPCQIYNLLFLKIMPA